MANIRDVATAAGVSVATACRAFKPDSSVSSELRERVLAAAHDLNYTLQPRIKSQVEPKYLLIMTGRVGYWKTVFEGIVYEATLLGYVPIVQYIPYSWGVDEVRQAVELFKNQCINITGIVLNASFSSEQYMELISFRPTVLCGYSLDVGGALAVSSDQFCAASDLANSLIEMGYVHPAIVTCSHNCDSLHVQRLEGFRYACSRHGIADVPCITESEKEDELVFHTLDFFFSRDVVPDLLLFTRAEEAIRFRMALAKKGVLVPEQMRLAAFDLDLLAGGTISGIDYVKEDFYQYGIESVRLLDDYIHGKISMGRKLFVDHKICLV